MNGQRSHLIALTAHGNAYLALGDADALASAEGGFGVPYIDELSFVSPDGAGGAGGAGDAGGAGGKIVARDPAGWLRWLHGEGVRRLDYVAFAWSAERHPGIAEHQAAGFSNAVPMAIQARQPGGLHAAWYPSWQVDPAADKQRPWRVTYAAGPPSAQDFRVPVPLAAATQRLSAALANAGVFAREAPGAEQPWAGIFDTALGFLQGAALPPDTPMSYLPRRGYGGGARRLMASADKADVFGGMGSWNDQGWAEPEWQARYEQVSARLYDAVKLAGVVATNAFDPAVG